MRSKIIILIILFVLAVPLFSDNSNPPKPVLKKGDVLRFIKTFPLLKEDFRKFGVKYDGKCYISGSVESERGVPGNTKKTWVG